MSVPGNAVDPKSWPSRAPSATSSPKAESFIDSKAQPPDASFFVAWSQVSRLAWGSAYPSIVPKVFSADFTGVPRQLRSSPTMSFQPQGPIELSSVFSNSSTVVKRSLPPRHNGIAPDALTFLRSARNALRV